MTVPEDERCDCWTNSFSLLISSSNHRSSLLTFEWTIIEKYAACICLVASFFLLCYDQAVGGILIVHSWKRVLRATACTKRFKSSWQMSTANIFFCQDLSTTVMQLLNLCTRCTRSHASKRRKDRSCDERTGIKISWKISLVTNRSSFSSALKARQPSWLARHIARTVSFSFSIARTDERLCACLAWKTADAAWALRELNRQF